MQVDETPLLTEKLTDSEKLRLSQNEISNQKNDRTLKIHSKGLTRKMQIWEAGGSMIINLSIQGIRQNSSSWSW